MPTTSIEETSDRGQHHTAEDKSPDDDHFGSSVGDNMRRLSISGDFENSDNDLPSSTSSTGLPLGWFAAVDEQSGDNLLLQWRQQGRLLGTYPLLLP